MNKLSEQDQQFQVENQQLELPYSLSNIKSKQVEVSYTGKDVSSDGGALLLKELDAQLGLIEHLVSCTRDERDQRYIDHSYLEMIKQRVFQIACGYEDGNDCNQLRTDSIFKLCANRLPESEKELASQPTISRLENAISSTQLYKMAQTFVDQFIGSYPQEPGLIIVDCDDTHHITYGDQQFTLFNNYYGEHCYMPLHIYEGCSGKLITTILKPGRRSKNVNVFAILKRIIAHLRAQWPHTIIVLRGDGHFCSPQFMDWAYDENNLHFVTGLTGNATLNERVKQTLAAAKRAFEHRGNDQKRYVSFTYKANSWIHEQRVIAKVEVTTKGTNIRYIVTDMQEYRSSHVYEKAYCARGAMELRIKEHKLYLKSERSSCNSFYANQFRLFLHSAAYVLIHTLQKEYLQGTEFANSTIKTIQLKVLKTAAWVKEMKTKIKIELPEAFAFKGAQKHVFDLLNGSG